MGRRKKGSKHVRSYEAMLGIWGLCVCRQGLCGGTNLLIYLFYWRIIALQCCGGLCSTSSWVSHIYMCAYIYIYISHPSSASLLPLLHSSPSSQSTRLSSLCYIHQLLASYLFYILLILRLKLYTLWPSSTHFPYPSVSTWFLSVWLF